MSEYWKSTPRYWCKHCKVFVRDTKLERQNHDATPRHQGNIKRFLRDLHRGHEKEEKDKDRAKSEVARLNGLVSGTGHAESSSSGFGRGATPSLPIPQATFSQRKQQLAQLAEMGVSIPDEFRGEMAMAGDWQVTSERIIDPNESQEKKLEASGFGIRKRVAPEYEEEAIATESVKRRWGSSYRTHPGDDKDTDLDALLNKPTTNRKLASIDPDVKQEFLGGFGEPNGSPPKAETDVGVDQLPSIKKEPSEGEFKLADANTTSAGVDNKDKPDYSAGDVVFKKRKAKNARQK